MVRFKGENVKTTNQHLTCIVNSLFPKGFKGVTPKDTPLNIFVKIIHFISQVSLGLRRQFHRYSLHAFQF